ncbi:MAG TPA: YdcH family protein [Thermoanaerobaculia bacterium]|nr:YdcH family protein [Thermoanaerobaculia bacterium]
MAERDEVLKTLLDEDPEFRTWNEEHHKYESRLAVLAAKSSLSPDEELEEKTLKKRKLHLKDQMAARMRGHSMAGTT